MARRGTLRREIRQLRRDLRKADLHDVEVQFASTRREVRVARQELRVELAKLNNLRTEGTPDRGLFAPQTAYDSDQQRLFDQIKTLRTTSDRAGGLNAAW